MVHKFFKFLIFIFICLFAATLPKLIFAQSCPAQVVVDHFVCPAINANGTCKSPEIDRGQPTWAVDCQQVGGNCQSVSGVCSSNDTCSPQTISVEGVPQTICTCSGSVVQCNQGGGGGGSCGGVGDTCAVNSDCCSGRCSGSRGICVNQPTGGICNLTTINCPVGTVRGSTIIGSQCENYTCTSYMGSAQGQGACCNWEPGDTICGDWYDCPTKNNPNKVCRDCTTEPDTCKQYSYNQYNCVSTCSVSEIS